ncbi:MAG: hypothetical protein AB7V58_13650 [Solirubrobacterales bacterium]
MASGNEHRMVFDIRGKRRHVIKAVYAILAVLMAGSLFLVVGPFNIGELVNSGGGSGSDLAQEYEKKAERIETELQQQPGDEALLLSLTRNQLNAAQQHLASGEESEVAAALQQYRLASNSWSEYLDATSEPNANTAQQVAPALFNLAFAENASSFESNVESAVQAQRIAAQKRPTLNSLSQLAFYEVYTFDYGKAEQVLAEARKLANTKFEREQLENRFESEKKSAESAQKQLAEIERATKQAQKNGAAASAPESLENPGGALGGTGLGE